MPEDIEREVSPAMARTVIEQSLATLRPRLRSFLGGRPFPGLARFAQSAIDQTLETLVADGILARSRRLLCPVCSHTLAEVPNAPAADTPFDCLHCLRDWTGADLDWEAAPVVYEVLHPVGG